MRGETGPDFIEALARGLDVIRVFEPNRPTMTLSEVAAATGLARPTARRMLLTLEELGYVRTTQGGFALTPRVLELGMAYIGSTSIWEIARPHMEQLVGHTGESSSLAQLDGSDIVYVARVAVPKIITLAVTIGTRAAGSDGGARAGDYLAQQFHSYGYQVERQAFPFAAWEDRGTQVLAYIGYANARIARVVPRIIRARGGSRSRLRSRGPRADDRRA